MSCPVGYDALWNADLTQIGAEAKAQRLDAEKIDFLPKQPARVVLAKAVGV